MLSPGPLFEREWRERFRRFASFLWLGGLAGLFALLVCLGVWRTGFDPGLSAAAWRVQGRALLDLYRWAGGLLFWGGALLLGATSVSDEKTASTWEHLLLCPMGGRGLAVGKIASGAAFLVALQLVLLPVLLIAGSCFGASSWEVASVMLSHLLLTVQGATLGFWGGLRGQTLVEGLVESLGGIARLAGQTVIFLVASSWFVVLLGSMLAAVATLAPSSVAVVLKWVLVAFVGALYLVAKGVVSFVAGMTGVGILAQSVRVAQFALLSPLLWAGQLAGVALFLKWSVWEVDYPARQFGGTAPPSRSNQRASSFPSAPPIRHATPQATAVRPTPSRPTSVQPTSVQPVASRAASARPASVPPSPPRPDPARPLPAAPFSRRVPPPFEESPPGQTSPPLFGASASRAEKPRPLIAPPPQPTQPLLPASLQTRPVPVESVPVEPVPFPTSAQLPAAPLRPIGDEWPPPTQAGASSPTRWQVLYRVWTWQLSPAQLAAFPIKERRESLLKTHNLLPTWEQTFAPAPAPAGAKDKDAPKQVNRLRAPVSRRWQELNPVLWLDLSRCLSLRSPDSNMVPILLSLGALGGSLLLAITLFLLVGWVQNGVLGGPRGDVSSLVASWNDLHWALWWGALGCGPIWGATGYVIERRTGMLVELRLTLISAKAMWWGKFLARFGIFAFLSLPLLAFVAFFAWNWPEKNASFEVASALLSSWTLAAWSVLACLWISDSSRKELASSLWCGAFALAWGVLLWNFPTFPWAPVHLLGASLAGGHLWARLKRLGFG